MSSESAWAPARVRGVTLLQQVAHGRLPEGPAASGTGRNIRFVARDGRLVFQGLRVDRSTDAVVGEATPIGDDEVVIRSVVVSSVVGFMVASTVGFSAVAALAYRQTGTILTVPAVLAAIAPAYSWNWWGRQRRRAAVYHEEVRRMLTRPPTGSDVSARGR